VEAGPHVTAFDFADDDDFTELHDAEFDRVDLVGKAANGTQFLIMKAQAQEATTMNRPSIAKAKAKPSERSAVFDAAGNLLGTVDPADVQELTPLSAPEKKPAKPATAGPPPVTAAELTPAPAAEAGTPVDAVVAKRSIEVAVRKARRAGELLNDAEANILRAGLDVVAKAEREHALGDVSAAYLEVAKLQAMAAIQRQILDHRNRAAR
jgi:hypothetical protein